MLFLLIVFPLVLGGVAYVLPWDRVRPWLLPVGGVGQWILAVLAIVRSGDEPLSALGGWLLLDPPGQVILGLVTLLFFLGSLYAPGYLALRADRPHRVFCANLFAALAMMTLVTLAHHLGLMWVAMEATTLATAPLLYFNHHRRSLEATWKYLLISSVGIALALFGSLFLAYAALAAGWDSTLLFDQLVAIAPHLSPPWLHGACVLLFLGYGTKMGLAPMHTWKPDAYGEAPGLVGMLLAGGVTSCAFLAVLRVYQICQASAEAEQSRQVLLVLGLLSMAVAAVFLAFQWDFKRMLAYSSIEHMGILAVGLGVGGTAVYGALLHAINNGLAKGVLFLSAGNIHRAYGSKLAGEVRGALQRVPLSGGLFLAGFLAMTGSPPFGPFVSLFLITSAALDSGQFLVGGLFLLLLGIVFVGMGRTVLAVVQGEAPAESVKPAFRDGLGTGLPVVLLLGLVLWLGLYLPPPVDALLRKAAAYLEVPR